MSEQKISHIRRTIRHARYVESQTHTLDNYLRGQASALHPMINLPKGNPEEALLAFVVRYIEQVPDFLEASAALMLDAGIYEQGRYFVEMAEDFFVEPPELLAEHSGLRELVDEAYLAHRLIEEVNDRVIVLCGVPLTPMDMTFANLVVHQLLGEEFANQLDLAVHYAIETLFPLDQLVHTGNFARFVRARKTQGWADALQRWPCLAGESAIAFQVGGNLYRNQSVLH